MKMINRGQTVMTKTKTENIIAKQEKTMEQLHSSIYIMWNASN